MPISHQEALDMNEATIQFVMRFFAVVIGVMLTMGMGTLCFVIFRDGNDPLVSQALDDIKLIAIGGFGSVVLMVTGRSIITNTYQRTLNQLTATNIAPPANVDGPVTPVPDHSAVA